MRRRLDEALWVLNAQGYLADYFVVPLGWVVALGLDHRGIILVPTDGGGDEYLEDYAKGWPARAVAVDGVHYARINMEEYEMDDKQAKELPSYAKEALDRLLMDELSSGTAARYTRVARLAELAQQIAGLYHLDVRAMMEGTGVGPPIAQGYPAPGGGLYAPAMMNYGARPQAARPQAEEDTVREAVSTAMPLLRTMALHNLLALEPRAAELGLDPAVVHAQIRAGAQKLLSDAEPLTGVSAASPPPAAALVPPEAGPATPTGTSAGAGRPLVSADPEDPFVGVRFANGLLARYRPQAPISGGALRTLAPGAARAVNVQVNTIEARPTEAGASPTESDNDLDGRPRL